MHNNTPIGIGVIGLGFMGQTHIRAYQAAARDGLPCELVAVCDGNPARLTGMAGGEGNMAMDAAGERLFDPASVRCCGQPDDLFNDPRVQLVSICTYTDTHVDLAIRALRAGKHVLVEKPLAVASQDVRRLADAVRKEKTLCMPAMCMRFWPEWEWLHARIRDGAFGPVHSATFQRLGSPPNWSSVFYADPARTGGALVDLHIHDVDFIYWCSGRPLSVCSAGSLQHITTLYRFAAGGPSHVAAEGAWDLSPKAGFRMRYLVNFENATADFDISRTPSLLVHHADRSEAMEFGGTTGYDGEVRHMVQAVQEGRCNADLRATIDDALAVAEILEAERASLDNSTSVAVK